VEFRKPLSLSVLLAVPCDAGFGIEEDNVASSFRQKKKKRKKYFVEKRETRERERGAPREQPRNDPAKRRERIREIPTYEPREAIKIADKRLSAIVRRRTTRARR